MKKTIWSILGIGLLLLAGCAAPPTAVPTATPVPPTPVPPTPAPPGPAVVAQRLADEMNAQNLTAIMALFDGEVVLNTGGPEPFIGREGAQTWAEEMIADNFHIDIDIVEVQGEVVSEKDVMTMDSIKAMGIAALRGTSEITVREGKICRLDFTFEPQSLKELMAATAPAIQPEELLGTWIWEGPVGVGTAKFRFLEDGTYEMIRYIVDSEVLWDTGSFEVSGSQLRFVSGDTSRYCGAGQHGVYQMTFQGDDTLDMAVVEEECMRRKPPIEEPIPWERYSS